MLKIYSHSDAPAVRSETSVSACFAPEHEQGKSSRVADELFFGFLIINNEVIPQSAER